jgi:protein-disulfide isomerase
MKKSHALIAATLTFNIGLSAALIRTNFDSIPFLGVEFGDAQPENTKGLLPPPAVLTRSKETQAYLLDTIRANPEAVRDAIIILQSRGELLSSANTTPDHNMVYEQGELTEEMDIEDASNAFVGGNPDGDVTIVQFFDYNCTHCQSAAPVVRNVVHDDGNIRLIYREFPILSPSSAFAARASLASRKQDLYEEFHYALMEAKKPLDEEAILAVARQVGIDVIKLASDMQDPAIVNHLKATQTIAAENGIEGTPSYAINGELNAGSPSAKALKDAIAKVRSR